MVSNPEVWKPTDNHYKDSFFGGMTIEPDRWNKLFPYRLLVVEADDSGVYRIVGAPKASKLLSKTDYGRSYNNAIDDSYNSVVGGNSAPSSGLDYVISETILYSDANADYRSGYMCPFWDCQAYHDPPGGNADPDKIKHKDDCPLTLIKKWMETMDVGDE